MEENKKCKPLPIGIDNFEMLITRGYDYETIYRYGIAFCGKDCLVKLQK